MMKWRRDEMKWAEWRGPWDAVLGTWPLMMLQEGPLPLLTLAPWAMHDNVDAWRSGADDFIAGDPWQLKVSCLLLICLFFVKIFWKNILIRSCCFFHFNSFKLWSSDHRGTLMLHSIICLLLLCLFFVKIFWKNILTRSCCFFLFNSSKNCCRGCDPVIIGVTLMLHSIQDCVS